MSTAADAPEPTVLRDPQCLLLRAAVVEVDGAGVLLVGSADRTDAVVRELLARGAAHVSTEQVALLPGTRTVFAADTASPPAGPVTSAVAPGNTVTGSTLPLTTLATTTLGVIVFLGQPPDGTAERLDPVTPEHAAERLRHRLVAGPQDGAPPDGADHAAVTDLLTQLAAAASVWDLDDRDPSAAAALVADLRPPLRRQVVAFTSSGPSAGRADDDPLAFALPGSTLGDLTGVPPLSAADLSAVVGGRCTGVLAEQLVRGRPCVSDRVAQQIHERHQAGQATCALLERELPRVVDLLERAGVRPVLLKGPVSAHDGPLPLHFRDYGDLDVLVPGQDMTVAVTALQAAGFERCFEQIAPEFDRRFAKSVTLRAPFSGDWDGREVPSFEVDLHRTLTPGPYGEVIPLDELHAAAVPARVGERWYRALHPTHRFLHHCLHVVLGSPEPQVHSVRDLVLSAPRTAAGVHDVVRTASRWGVVGAVQRAVAVAEDAFPGALVRELATRINAAQRRPTERLYLATYHRSGRTYSLPALATLVALPTWRDRVDMATMLVRHRRSRPGD